MRPSLHVGHRFTATGAVSPVCRVFMAALGTMPLMFRLHGFALLVVSLLNLVCLTPLLYHIVLECQYVESI